MPDFTELLKRSLSGVNDAFNVARTDLNDTVASVDAAVTELTTGVLRVRLQLIENSLEVAVYTVLLVRSTGAHVSRLAAFRITRTGYPIEFGTLGSQFETEGLFENRAAIESFFANMLADQTSPLVVQIAFVMR
jgi:hypothetical protein